jgi:hypothetical protein
MGIRTIETGRFGLGGRRIILAATALAVVAGGTMAGVSLEGDGDSSRTAATAYSDTLAPRFVEQVQERRLSLDDEAVAPAAETTNIKLQKSLDLFLTDPVEAQPRVNMKLVRSLDLLSDR